MVRDARAASETMFFQNYKQQLQAAIDKHSPDPLLGSDVGACVTFKREGLMEAQRILSNMIRLAEEKLADE